MTSADPREVLLVVSELLAYPDERLVARRASLDREVEALPSGPRRPLEEFLRYLAGRDLVSAQEEYVRTFDFAGGVPLYLTYATLRDDPRRAQGLLELKSRYRAAGFTSVGGELPDYLPMVLEFLGMAEPQAARTVGREQLPALEAVREGLQRRASPYAPLLDAGVGAVRELLRPSLLGRDLR